MVVGSLIRFLAALLLVAMLPGLTACGGGEFAPRPGPFIGELTVGGESVGDFTFTTANGFIAGTCTLIHNDQTTVVAISGRFTGAQIDGELRNVNLGAGPFDGTFVTSSTATGTFTYSDAGGVSTQTGTWTATTNAGLNS